MISIKATSKHISIEGQGINAFAVNAPVSVQDANGRIMISFAKFTHTFTYESIEVNGRKCKNATEAIGRIKKGLLGKFSIL